ncbi:hypothetical protein RN001_016381 [Aquatica leii]|uniref:Uncharacterized protein n=1 Tax=Aquatica leii TaxID=1421715 RepID=A0AAN7PP48_9COLE|nr:hypothetical protein RN001_016381 [Aquatica leii]
MYSFNIHVLATGYSVFYAYPEIIGHKRPNEVCSFLFDFLMNHLNPEITDLHIFCNFVGGQNKNFTVFRFLHYMVHYVKRLTSVTMIFPIRRHSYMECDKNMGLINLRIRMESPDDWYKLIRSSRVQPSPFVVVEINQTIIRNWSAFLTDAVSKKFPFKTQPIRKIAFSKDHPRLVHHRSTYHGHWETTPITSAKKRGNAKSTAPSHAILDKGEFELPLQNHQEYLPIKNNKYHHILKLRRFCTNPATADFLKNLSHQ